MPKNAVTIMNVNVVKYIQLEIVYGIIEKNAPLPLQKNNDNIISKY